MESSSKKPTILTYLQDSSKIEDIATFLSLLEVEGKGTALILDKTIFYPQGGGQPADQGLINGDNAELIVSDVRMIEGIVHHFGNFSRGNFAQHDTVNLKIDIERRNLHTRLHSAGHLIDDATKMIGLTLTPTKGYHFPQGPYVEYEGEVALDQKEELRLRLEAKVNELASNKSDTKITFTDNKIRVVAFTEGMGCPCGGTHVSNTGDIGKISIKKISSKNGQVRISYFLS